MDNGGGEIRSVDVIALVAASIFLSDAARNVIGSVTDVQQNEGATVVYGSLIWLLLAGAVGILLSDGEMLLEAIRHDGQQPIDPVRGRFHHPHALSE